MSDEVSRILREQEQGSLSRQEDYIEGLSQADFDEDDYLRRYPDVADAIQLGAYKSGYQHYVRHGFYEGRSLPGAPREPRDRLIPTLSTSKEAGPCNFRCSVESIIVCRRAGVMLVGWVDDAVSALDCVRVVSANWRLVFDASSLVRVRREDVESALGSNELHPFGFVGLLYTPDLLEMEETCTVEVWLRNGAVITLQSPMRAVGNVELRNVILGHLAGAKFFGNQRLEATSAMGRGIGSHIVRLNRAITSQFTAAPYVERFGVLRRPLLGSIIVCLYGKSEFLAIQNCLFAGNPGIEDYEFIYVVNSPELGEKILQEARAASLTYGLPLTVVLLSGNAGFGAANNVGVVVSRTQRILNVNPDVFPYEQDWAARHTTLLYERPANETRLFGTALYYDDGSLMHGGMFFEVDTGISVRAGAIHPERIVRTEHYGKGAPAGATKFIRPRPVPAVTGAFISSDRAWYEALGGFTEDYVFGHYEDADICLKSLKRGTPTWMHDLRLWHLEGKGSTRLPPHEGGSIVNSWLFSQTWSDTIMDGLVGPNPTHPAFAPPVEPSSSTYQDLVKASPVVEVDDFESIDLEFSVVASSEAL